MQTVPVASAGSLTSFFGHGLSLLAHVLLLGGAALTTPAGSVEEAWVEVQHAGARLTMVSAAPDEVEEEEARGPRRTIAGPCEEGTMGPARDDAQSKLPRAERSQAHIMYGDHRADEVPASGFEDGVHPSPWAGRIWSVMDWPSPGHGGKQMVDVEIAGSPKATPPPASGREGTDAASTSPASAAPKPWFCPPSQGDSAIFCRKPFGKTR